MKQKIINLVGFLTKIISFIIPIDKRLLVFHSTPNYGDNSYAVFQYLIDNYPNKYKYVWLIDDEDQKEIIINDLEDRGYKIEISILKRKSFKSIISCFRAYKLFNSVGLFVHICFHQDKRINMWHGMPLKRIYSDSRNGDYTIATSQMYVDIMSEGLKIPRENVLLLGQPRNDMLFHPEMLHEKYAKQLKGYDTIGIWMPTFRRSHIDKSYSDGVFNEDSISFFKIQELTLLNENLKKLKALLIIKLHPLDILQTKKFEKYSNIMVLKNKNFEQRFMYPLLANCDFLLSDFSSVVIDYDILNRPIGMTLDNVESYSKTRGLYTTKFPGVSIYTKDELFAFIEKVHNNEIQYNGMDGLYNKYKDDKSTRRLLQYFNLV